LAYSIEIHRAARKQMLAIPRNIQLEIARSIDSLANNPRPMGYRRLRGVELFRLRIGRYRVIYAIDDKARKLTVVKIAPRREDTYQGL